MRTPARRGPLQSFVLPLLAVLTLGGGLDASAFSGGITGRTMLPADGGPGCTGGGCHGDQAQNTSSMTVTISGPSTLNAGETGNYTITATLNGIGAGQQMGFNVAASAGTLGTGGASNVQVISGELTHQAPRAQTNASNTASYSFQYTNPASSTLGQTRTLYGTSRIKFDGGWRHAPNFTITTTVPTFLLTLTKAGTGTGTVTSNPAGISCTTGCASDSASYTSGTSVTLTQSAPLASGFTGWSGACSGTGSCTVSMTQARNVTATFVLKPVITSSSATLNGTVNTPITPYQITASNSPTSFNATNLPPGLTVNTINGVISGTPTSGGARTVSIQAINAGGTGSTPKLFDIAKLNQTVAFTTPAPTPTFSSFGTFTVNASATSGLPVDFGTTSFSVCGLQSATPTTATFTMFTAGSCIVTADQFGDGVYNSATQQTQTVVISATVPGAPTITGIQGGNTAANVLFTAPSQNGGSPITSYNVSCTPGPVNASGPASPVTVSGLTNDVVYTCTVAAVNSIGAGPQSAPQTVTPRADADGQLDTTFGSAGTSAAIFSGVNESARALLVDGSNRILVGGGMNFKGRIQFAVARFLSNGLIDTSFGSDGNGISIIELPDGTLNAVEGLALDAEGRILIAGSSGSGGQNSTFVVARMGRHGGADASFNGSGYLYMFDVSAEQGVARRIAYDSKFGIVAAGWDRETGAPVRFAVVRLKDDGTRNTSFGNNGVMRVDVGLAIAGVLPGGAATGLAYDSKGRILVSGFATGPSMGDDMAVLRIEDKVLDSSFGVGGIAMYDGGGSDVVYDMQMMGDEPVLSGVYNVSGVAFDFTWVRFKADGTPSVIVVQDQGGNATDLATSVALTPDGKVVLGGLRYGGSSAASFDFAFARYLADGTPDSAFGSNGRVSIPNPGLDQVVMMRPHLAGTVVFLGFTNGQNRIGRLVLEGPLPFAFNTRVTNVGTLTLLQSNTVPVDGLVGNTYVSITGGEYSIDCTPAGFTTQPGTIGPGHTICVRHVTASGIGIDTTTTLTIGGYSAVFSSQPSFIAGSKALDVQLAGTGTGTVTSNPAGIACGADCVENYPTNQPVTLTAAPAVGSTFAGWSGACTGTGACNLTMDGAKNVTATFNVPVVAVAPPFDFNGNGKSDLLWRNTDGRVAIWLMDGLVATTTAEVFGGGTNWSPALVADFNGDGKYDIAWQNTDGRVAIYLVNGTTFLATQLILGPGGGWSVIHAPDLNGDGKADLVFQNVDGSVAIWTMNGTTMTGGTTIMGPGSGWSVIRTADFDGDGKDDLLWRHTDGRHAIWTMNGLTIASTTQILNAGGWTATHAPDLNGDGKADLVWQHTDGTIAVWLMNGAVMTSGTGLLNAGSGWAVTRVGDFNGDGKDDLFFLHADGRAAIYLMNGITPTATQQILNAGGGWSAKRLGDVNGDGKADIIWQNVDGSVAVWIMNGTVMTSGSGLIGAGSGWSVSGVSQ